MKQVLSFALLAFLVGNAVGQNRTAGGAKPSGRILNGATIVSIVDYKYFVALCLYGFAYCGASVISNKHALTAAHCLNHNPPIESLTIYGGSSNQYTGGTVFPVEKVIIHPGYTAAGLNFDAAIVFISTTFAGHQNIAPIALQTKEITSSPSRPSWCSIIGWGYTNDTTQDNPKQLQQIWTPVISQYICGKPYSAQSPTPEMICTQLPKVDTCSGDSGGPLVCNGLLTGIVSWSLSDCTGEYPSVFAKITSTSIRSFIKEHTGV